MIEFDPSSPAKFDPPDFQIADFPSKAVLTYEDHYLDLLRQVAQLTEVVDSAGRQREDFWICEYLGQSLLIMTASEGAPTSAIMIEQAIASGVKSLVVFGSCGALDKDIKTHDIILPTAAIREEGVSYHYLPAGDGEVKQRAELLEIAQKVFDKHNLKYSLGKVWTTDAVYRETEGKIEQMVKRGAVMVDMECSANLAVAEFRGVKLLQFLLAYDNLIAPDGDSWREDYFARRDAAIWPAVVDMLEKMEANHES